MILKLETLLKKSPTPEYGLFWRWACGLDLVSMPVYPGWPTMTWLTTIQSEDENSQSRLTAICSVGGAVGSSSWSSNLLRFARRAHIGVE